MHTSLEEYQKFDAFLHDLFRRFPDCYYVETQRKLLKEGKSYRHRVRFDNPPLLGEYEVVPQPRASFLKVMGGK